MAAPGATPAISVIMSVYNDAPFLAASVESILAQTEGDFEFLIVDDGSSDGSGAILDGYAARDPRVRVIHQPNHGLIASLNTLIAEARAPLLARMDGDDVSRPERLARQHAWLAEHPAIAVLGTNTDELDVAGRLFPCKDLHPLTPEAIAERLQRGGAICHPSVMMRADAVRSAGGYRAAFRHCEDYDLWLRMSERFALANLPDRLLLYRRSPGQVSEKHTFIQAVGATMARFAHGERIAGRPDPFARAETLPGIAALEAELGRPGLAAQLRAEIIERVKYSPTALAGDALGLMVAHLEAGGDRDGFWRTVLRMTRLGLVRQAASLSRAMLAGRRRPIG